PGRANWRFQPVTRAAFRAVEATFSRFPPRRRRRAAAVAGVPKRRRQGQVGAEYSSLRGPQNRKIEPRRDEKAVARPYFEPWPAPDNQALGDQTTAPAHSATATKSGK